MIRTMFATALLAGVAMLPAGALASTFVPTPSGYLFGNTNGVTGTFTDTFTFDTTADQIISGALSTQILAGGGAALADLDFLSVTFDGIDLAPGDGNTDASEVYYLPSTLFAAGASTLSVTYRVDTATVAPSYAGTLTLTPAAVVAEPATWAMLIGGFGVVGLGLRRNGSARRFVQAV